MLLFMFRFYQHLSISPSPLLSLFNASIRMQICSKSPLAWLETKKLSCLLGLETREIELNEVRVRNIHMWMSF